MPSNEYLIRYTITGENPLNYKIPKEIEMNRKRVWNLKIIKYNKKYNEFFEKVFKTIRKIDGKRKLEKKLEDLLEVGELYVLRDEDLIKLGFLIPVKDLCRIDKLFSFVTISLYAHKKQKEIRKELSDYLHLKEEIKKGIEKIPIYKISLDDLKNKKFHMERYIRIKKGNFEIYIKEDDFFRINPFGEEVRMIKNSDLIFVPNERSLSLLIGRSEIQLRKDYEALQKLQEFFKYVKGKKVGKKTIEDYLNDPYAISCVNEYLRWQKIKEKAISRLKPSI